MCKKYWRKSTKYSFKNILRSFPSFPSLVTLVIIDDPNVRNSIKQPPPENICRPKASQGSSVDDSSGPRDLHRLLQVSRDDGERGEKGSEGLKRMDDMGARGERKKVSGRIGKTQQGSTSNR